MDYSCPTGKVRHENLVVAQKIVRRKSSSSLRAYHCAQCGGWHTGTPTGKVHLTGSKLSRLRQGRR